MALVVTVIAVNWMAAGPGAIFPCMARRATHRKVAGEAVCPEKVGKFRFLEAPPKSTSFLRTEWTERLEKAAEE